ncbi:hypothetical protein AAFF_G00248540 [Aldrovandia affinis]|uniref:Uncharacterized protein n=1 Tax=Aldrovandia affinis TaxID=143900 RepID=A0AAD7RFY9_9TELE|nr:hypothetical protein AAFF_G00248540 [Aldrovandia affinis]
MGTMRIPAVGVPFLGCLFLLLLLCFLAATESRLVQACPGLTTSGCSCTDERTKAHAASSVRKRVSCSGEELAETPQASLLPNRTVTLILSNNRIRVLRNGSFAGLAALEKLQASRSSGRDKGDCRAGRPAGSSLRSEAKGLETRPVCS